MFCGVLPISVRLCAEGFGVVMRKQVRASSYCAASEQRRPSVKGNAPCQLVAALPMKLGKRAPPVARVLWQHSQPCRAVCAVPTASMASAGAAADGLHAGESVRDVSAETHVSDAEAEAEATFARASQALQAVVADQQARIQQLERALAARAASEVLSIDPQVR